MQLGGKPSAEMENSVRGCFGGKYPTLWACLQSFLPANVDLAQRMTGGSPPQGTDIFLK